MHPKKARTHLKTIALAVLLLVFFGLPVAIGQSPPSASPILLTTFWYQDGPFAEFTPKHDRVGCWSTAVAQIMYYHRLQPIGRVQYTCSDGTVVDEDLSAFSFDWRDFVDRVTQETPKVNQRALARFSYAAALVVRKDFGTGSYKRLLNAVQDLESHYAVDSSIYVSLGSTPISAVLNSMTNWKRKNAISQGISYFALDFCHRINSET